MKDIDVIAIVKNNYEYFRYFYRDGYLWARIQGSLGEDSFDYGMRSRNLKQELETHINYGHEVITDKVEIKKYLMLEELLK